MTIMESIKYLTVNEAASLLRVDTETVYRWINSTKLPAAKIGGIWRIRVEDIDALFKRSERVEKDG